MFKLTEEQIEKAVNWWADKIDNPKFDNGDRENPMAMMLAVLANTSVENTQLKQFKKALREKLSNKEFYSEYDATLDVDYGPCALLAEAAEEAGLNTGITTFPWKTTMWFDENGKVTVSYGYGAPVEEI